MLPEQLLTAPYERDGQGKICLKSLTSEELGDVLQAIGHKREVRQLLLYAIYATCCFVWGGKGRWNAALQRTHMIHNNSGGGGGAGGGGLGSARAALSGEAGDGVGRLLRLHLRLQQMAARRKRRGVTLLFGIQSN
jgi:hypothetical protein